MPDEPGGCWYVFVGGAFSGYALESIICFEILYLLVVVGGKADFWKNEFSLGCSCDTANKLWSQADIKAAYHEWLKVFSGDVEENNDSDKIIG